MTHGNAFRNHAIKADVHRVLVGKRYWNFTFGDRWGPLLTDEWGEPIDNMPLADEQHPFWDKFEAWQAAQSGEEQPLIPSEASTAALATDESILPDPVRGEDHG